MTTLEEETKVKLTIKELLEVGAHFGHQKSRRNPKMAPYIYTTKNGISVIDLAKTMHQVKQACAFVRKTVRAKKSILFVGTKKQAKGIITELADESGEFYVSQRWLGGMLTNLSTIRMSVKKLEKIEKKVASNAHGLTKKEIVHLTKLQIKLEKVLSGIRLMRKTPGLVIVVDPVKEHIAVAEARKLGIPVMAIVDTNANPDLVDYIIAANDDALKSNKVILQELNNAIIDEKKANGIPLDRQKLEEQEKAKKIVKKPSVNTTMKEEPKNLGPRTPGDSPSSTSPKVYQDKKAPATISNKSSSKPSAKSDASKTAAKSNASKTAAKVEGAKASDKKSVPSDTEKKDETSK